MTLSGATDFWFTTQAVDIIIEAYERIGMFGGQISGNQMDSAVRSLQYLFTDYSNKGINLWKVELQSTVPLSANQSTITLSQDVIEVLQVYTRTTSNGVNNDLILTPISRAEYAALPNKAQTSTRPTQYYFERTITPTLYLWQLPQDNTVSLYYYVMRMQDDIGALSNTVDAPQRWADAIAAGLAAKLAVKFAPDRMDVLQALADKAFAAATIEDTENVPMRIAPDTIGRR